MSEIWNLSAMCRCCHADGVFKSLQALYVHDGASEIYAELLRDTFGIHIYSGVDSTVEMNYTICESCIHQLQQAHRFKEQVLICERKLGNYCKSSVSGSVTKSEVWSSDIKITSVRSRLRYDDDSADDVNTDDNNAGDVNVHDVKIEEHFEDVADGGDDGRGETITWEARGETIKLSSLRSRFCFEEDTSEVTKLKTRTTVTVPPPVDDVNTHDVDIDDINANGVNTYVVTSDDIKAEKCFENSADGDTATKKDGVGISMSVEMKFACDFCNKPIATKESLHQHYSDKHIPKDFSCTLCQLPYKCRLDIIKHLKLRHENHTCRFCTETFTSLYTLKQHERSHTKPGYVCDICQKVLQSKKTLKHHLALHVDKAKDFVCKICGFASKKKAYIKSHVANVHENQRSFKCDMCDKTYKQKKHLVTHTRSVHTGERPFQCDLCFNSFFSSRSLRGHIINKHGKDFITKVSFSEQNKIRVRKQKKTKRFVCDNCKKIFTLKDPLNKHIKYCYGLGKKYVCETCGRVFYISRSLKNHVLAVHDNARPYKCGLCDKLFNSDYNLKVHMRIHTGERPYPCDVCSESFISRARLLDHKTCKHSNTKGFVCDYCKTIFKHKDSVKRHIVSKHHDDPCRGAQKEEHNNNKSTKVKITAKTGA